MGTESKTPRESAQLQSASPETGGKTLTPPPFQLQAAAQLKEDEEAAAPAVETAGAAGPVAATPTQESEVTTDTPETEPEQTREERISELLQAHYDGFAAITVNVPNPVPTPEAPTLPCEVRPPYMINSGRRITNAVAARNRNTRVRTLINTYPWGFRHGKASATDITTFLQAAIDQGLTTTNTSEGLRDFLSLYGIGVDCSGLTSQGYNYLLTQLGLTEEAEFDVNNTGSGSFRDANPRFTAVSAPSDLKPGDALYLDNPAGIDHVRMVQNVTVNGTNIDFVTIESAGGDTNGPRQKHWRFTDATDFGSLQESSDDGVTYTDSTENQEFARFDALYPAEETGDAETPATTTGGN